MIFSERLKKNAEFRNVYRQGRSFANRQLVMYIVNNDLEKNRLGISVSKKVGNSVIRHHLTRLIREAYRLSESSFCRGYDIVVVARVNAKDCTYFDIERAMLHLGKLHHILEDKNEEADD